MDMALQWTPLRRRTGAVARARQNVQTLEHQTQSNVLLAFKLSMVTANGVPAVNRPNLRTTYRKMADIGVQCDPQETVDMSLFNNYESEAVSSTVAVAEINTSAEPSELPSHSPLSMQSSTSSSGSSSEERERKRASSNLVSEDVDAICVQQTESMAEDVTAQLKPTDKSEPDGFFIPEKPETSCGLDCLYVTMKCCECTIL